MERAAVIGRKFHRGALVELLPEPLRTEVDVNLRSLVRKELISPDRSLLPGEDAYRFRHQLIRDTAYDSIPKAERAELHERFAAWLTALVGDDAAGQDETVGSHLERASRFLAELSPGDEHGRALASRAASLMITAGFRARDRGDEGTATSLLRRADALLSPDDTRRVPVLLALGESFDDDASIVCLSEAAHLAEQARDQALIGWTRAELAYRLVGSGTASTSWDEAARTAEEAIAALEGGAEPRGLAAALMIRGVLEENRGRLALANPWYARSLDVASAGGLPLEASVARGLLAGTWLLGETPAPEAVRRLGELLSASALDRVAELELTWRLGVFLVRAGEIGEGGSLVGIARGWVEDLGTATIGINFDWWVATWVDPWVLDPASWEADLRGRFGDPVDPACPNRTVAPALAVAQCEQGKFGEAERLTSATADLAGNGDVSVAATWHGARARALARLGRQEEADRLSARAVAMTDDIDRLDVRGDISWHRADVLRALGRGGEADDSLRMGIEAFERKGFGPSADKLRGLLGLT
jgi:tetratricopeptide (TPR) repeat protein